LIIDDNRNDPKALSDDLSGRFIPTGRANSSSENYTTTLA